MIPAGEPPWSLAPFQPAGRRTRPHTPDDRPAIMTHPHAAHLPLSPLANPIRSSRPTAAPAAHGFVSGKRRNERDPTPRKWLRFTQSHARGRRATLNPTQNGFVSGKRRKERCPAARKWLRFPQNREAAPVPLPRAWLCSCKTSLTRLHVVGGEPFQPRSIAWPQVAQKFANGETGCPSGQLVRSSVERAKEVSVVSAAA